MAAARNSGGQQSPNANTRNEKIFEDAQYTGVINLSGKKLKEFPRCAKKYDLSDTVAVGKFSKPPCNEWCRLESRSTRFIILAAAGQIVYSSSDLS